MRTFTVTYNKGIGQPYKEIQVQAEGCGQAEAEAYRILGNIRIVSVRG